MQKEDGGREVEERKMWKMKSVEERVRQDVVIIIIKKMSTAVATGTLAEQPPLMPAVAAEPTN